MKKLAITPLLLAAIALHGCDTVPGGRVVEAAPAIVATATSVSGNVLLRGTQGLIVANEFYQAVNRTALAVVRSGVLNRQQLLAVQDANQIATAALVRGKAAKDDVAAAREAAIVTASAFKLISLTGIGKMFGL